MQWYIDVLKKYAVFTGRARRTEYWMFILFHFIVSMVLITIELVFGIAPHSDTYVLFGFYFYATLLPWLAVGARRLHDTGQSAWWLLLALVPAGGIVLFVFFVQDSQLGNNQYGPNPKGLEAPPPTLPDIG